MDKINILLVEDQVLTRMGMTMALNRNSECRIVAEASSVHEAKQQLKQNQDLDLVLLDLMLPDGNGIEVVRFLKQRGSEYAMELNILERILQKSYRRCQRQKGQLKRCLLEENWTLSCYVLKG